MWTHFWDMRSGGGQKEKWAYIYIEAPEKMAKIIFYNRFGHNPERVTCTCCGEDYSISEHESLRQLTAFHRNCRPLETPKQRNGLYKDMSKDKYLKNHYYLEENEKPRKGYIVDNSPRYRKYQTLKEYLKNKDVLVIYSKDIKPKERKGEVPVEGYVWI
jgi:hypothetical protein